MDSLSRSLQDNSLTSLSDAPFDGLSELVVLLLANNQLTKLGEDYGRFMDRIR